MSGFGWVPKQSECSCHIANSLQGRCCHGNLPPAPTPTYTPPSSVLSFARPSYPSCPAPAPTIQPSYIPPSYAPHTTRTNISQGPGYYWVDTVAGAPFPSTAVRGGSDIDGQPIYVGRAFHEGDWIPAKVIPGRRVAYICYGGKEHTKHNFQVLCEQKFHWVRAHGGHIPPGAVEGGRTSSGEILYIGRAHHQGSHTVGKVHPSHHCCYIPFGGREISYKDYEVLVLMS